MHTLGDMVMYEYRCKVVHIVDGDTVDVDIDLGFGVWIHNERIRLYGMDAPESRTRDLEEKKFGILAKEFVQAKLPLGSTQKLVTKSYDSTGKYGRILGTFKVFDFVTDSEQTLTEIMIRDHYAVAYYGQHKDEVEQAHLENRIKLIEAQGV
jgi:micrococcal nuclease